MQRVDVAVVGGGPAGSAAAHAAADAGADVVLFEKGVPRADREGLGPDSTDAAGMLDYWVDLMGMTPDEIPDDVVLQHLEGAEFAGPNESVLISSTGMDSTYDGFGFTFHRARFDDWLHERAADAGAKRRVGVSVTDVATDPTAGYEHTLTTSEGADVVADRLILADGPQRTVTAGVLDDYLEGSFADRMPTTETNHIAYQEYRELPEELFDPELIRFWWGIMPGHTAYPWIFPNDDGVARVGLTMPIGLDVEDYDASEWPLLREDDDSIPDGSEYIERFLQWLYPAYDLADFPVVEDRGKRNGTETYPISSTSPIESPTGADVAVVGGAMGTTSAFHEGGDHVAVRTGAIAGDLAANDKLSAYNDAWQAAIGDEVLRSIAMAEVVRGWGPDDWDASLRTVREMLGVEGSKWRQGLAAGWRGISVVARYAWAKRQYRDGGYVQIDESEYTV